MKNLFTTKNAAMLLIDHQQGTIKLAQSIDYNELLHNTRALCRLAVETGMPLVLTSSQEEHFQGLLLEDIQKIAPTEYTRRIKRPGVVDAWMYEDFKNAVEENKYKYPWVSDQDSALQDLSEMGPLDSKEALKNYLKAVYNNWKNSYDSITEENKGNYIDGDNLWGFKRDTLRRYGHHKFEDVRAIPNVDDPYNGEEFKGKN